jgi:hypothetical protein
MGQRGTGGEGGNLSAGGLSLLVLSLKLVWDEIEDFPSRRRRIGQDQLFVVLPPSGLVSLSFLMLTLSCSFACSR